MGKTIMEELSIDEISIVDRPAQKPAKATIIKSEDGIVEDENEDVQKWDIVDFSTGVSKGHSHGVKVGLNHRAEVEINIRHASLNDTANYTNHSHDLVKDEKGKWSLTENMGHSHTIDDKKLQKRLDEIADKIRQVKKNGDSEMDNKVEKGNENENSTENSEDVSKMSEEKKKKMEEEKKMGDRMKKMESIIALSGVEKSFYDGLADETAKDEFLAKSADDRKAQMEEVEKNEKSDDPVVYKCDDGTEIRKSDGETVLKLAKDNDLQKRENAKLAKKTADAEVSEVVKSLEHLPGTEEVKTEIVKALNGFIKNDDIRNECVKVLKSASEMAENGEFFVEKGHAGETDPTQKSSFTKSEAEDELKKRTDEYVKSHSDTNWHDAYAIVLEQNEDLYEIATATE